MSLMRVVMVLAVATVVPACLAACCPCNQPSGLTRERENGMAYEVNKSEAEWRAQLTPEQYRVTREGDTERPFSGEYYQFKGDGEFVCVCCGQTLFDSDTKYESGSGWPSFWQPVDGECIEELEDTSHGMVRTEVRCSRCGAHLGHVFTDGPKPTGLRYCINSVSLLFKGEKK